MTESHAKRLQDALEWYFKNQDSDDRTTVTTTTCIFQLNISTLRKAIQRQLTPALPSVQPEGRLAFLKPYQREVLLAHICNQAYDRNPLNRAMVIQVATYLKSDRKEPSITWLRRFIKDNLTLHVITTKLIKKE
ncbi:hypothetical protein B7463_g9099, partial [Scytalidium lignicola]